MDYALMSRKATLKAIRTVMTGITRRASRSSAYSTPAARRRTGVRVSVSHAGVSFQCQFVPAEVPADLCGYQVTLDGHLLIDLLSRMAGELVCLSQVDGGLVLESAGFSVNLIGWDVRTPDPLTAPAAAKAVTPTKHTPRQRRTNSAKRGNFYTSQNWSL